VKTRNRICYHCRSAEANPRSNFCNACLGGGRGLWHPPQRQEKSQPGPLTRLLLLAAIGSTVWLIFKTAEAVMQP